MSLENIILLIVLIVLILSLLDPMNKLLENFNYDDMLGFYRLDDSLIKKFKINSSYNLYDDEILNLFKNDSVIRMVIPDGYEARVIYKFKKLNKRFSKTLDFPSGYHDIKLTLGNEILSQIDIKQQVNIYNGDNTTLINYNSPFNPPSRNIFITDRYGVIYRPDDIDLNNTYTYSGINNYWKYPFQRRINYRYNRPWTNRPWTNRPWPNRNGPHRNGPHRNGPHRN